MSDLPSATTPGPDHAAKLSLYESVPASAVEPKTKAATIAAGGSAAVVTPFVVYVVDQVFYGGGEIDVPAPVFGVIGLVVTTALTFAASYRARHVQRL